MSHILQTPGQPLVSFSSSFGQPSFAIRWFDGSLHVSKSNIQLHPILRLDTFQQSFFAIVTQFQILTSEVQPCLASFAYQLLLEHEEHASQKKDWGREVASWMFALLMWGSGI
jgi:hypothetical protein